MDRDDQKSSAAEIGVAESEANDGRRRRETGLLLGACTVVVACALGLVAIAVLGGDREERRASPPTEPPAPVAHEVPDGASPFTIFDALPDGAVVLTVGVPFDTSSIGEGIGSVIVVDPERGTVTTLPIADLYAGIEGDANRPFGGLGWPAVALVAVDPAQSVAVFYLSDPLGYGVPQVAVHDWNTGTTLIEDPCSSTLQRINLSPWCREVHGSPTITDPATGEIVTVDGFEYCVGADRRLGGLLVANCVKNEYEGYVVTVDPASGEVVSQSPLGLGAAEAPWVVGDQVFSNSTTVEGQPVLQDSGGGVVEIGGGWVGGLAAGNDWLLVRTSSDDWGPQSTYGRVLGLWNPDTDDFTPLEGTEFDQSARISVVTVIG